MPQLVPLKSIGVSREGQTIYPALNEPFDFTESEKSDLDKLSEVTKDTYYRKPINEARQTKAVEQVDIEDLSKLNKAKLIEVAKAAGVDVDDDDTKAEIIAAIEAAQAGEDL